MPLNSQFLPRQNSERFPRRAAVTIVAGFRCVDGIVICSDTQENMSGYIKRDVPKIEVREAEATDGPRAIFAGSGDGGFVDYLVDKLWDAMKSSTSVSEMTEAAEKEILTRYTELTPAYPSGLPDAELLVSLWASPHEMDLIKINGPVVNRGCNLEAIGYGWVIATYIAERLLWIKTYLADAVPIAIYMIEQAKRHVSECGGETLVTTLSSIDGKILTFDKECMKDYEQRIEIADERAREIVGLALNDRISDEQFDLLLEDSIARLKASKRKTNSKKAK
jgi:hypothetical protein